MTLPSGSTIGAHCVDELRPARSFRDHRYPVRPNPRFFRLIECFELQALTLSFSSHRHRVISGTTSIIDATETSTSSGTTVIWGQYTEVIPPQTETQGGSTTIIGGTTLAPTPLTVTPNAYPTTVPSTTDPKVNPKTVSWTSGPTPAPTADPGCPGCGTACKSYSPTTYSSVYICSRLTPYLPHDQASSSATPTAPSAPPPRGSLAAQVATATATTPRRRPVATRRRRRRRRRQGLGGW